MSLTVSIDDVAFVRNQVLKTPIRRSETAIRPGAEILVKDETIQHSGSFKYRGAVLGVRNAQGGVIAAGSGNFPIAVGMAAKALNKPACLIVPHDIPAFKLGRARDTGADIKFVERSELVSAAEEDALKLGWRNLHAFEDAEMITGSYTLGLELAEAINDSGKGSNAVVIACGGGGLSSGVSLALREQTIDASVFVIEPESHARYAAARNAGKPVRIEPTGTTRCDALQSRMVGQKAFDILERSGVIPCVTSDRKIDEAVKFLRASCGIRAEASGALAIAAVLEGIIPEGTERLWVIACGGNVAFDEWPGL